jgi:ribulose-5-phosphate 4-epimerase/fuculose-1-phosphate aldolase
MNATETLSIPSLRDLVSPQEWETRVDLAACYRLVAHFGWSDLVFTHITARIPARDRPRRPQPADGLADVYVE